MAAYAALVSLMHTIDSIERHPSPPISLHKNQVESLTEKANFLQEFLEGYHSPFDYSDEADPLEVRIADAAHAAEDVIEIKIVDRIHSRPTTRRKAAKFSKLLLANESAGIRDQFNEDLEKVIEEMELIKNDVKEMVRENAAAVEPQLHGNDVSADDAGGRNSEMVGFDDVLLQLLERLTRGDSNRQIIPIVGMGGIGKTTLAKNVFGNALIKEHFDVCVWATISQDYNVGQTLGEILSQVGGISSGKSENELREILYKYLCGRRYLVIMDDMWSLEVWDKMILYFPEYNNGSRILVTTRMSNLAAHLTDPNSLLDMKFLDKGSAWNLFSKIVFGGKSFPHELVQIGNKIVDKCNGLPLSIVVMGGLLAKSQHTLQYWHQIERNLSSESDEYCLRILKTSYNHLPAYLKPCFLYLGMFEEDSAISVSKLIRLWVSEGFLKPINQKSPETIAKEYLKELVDRNLILVDKLGLVGNMKYCKVHDLLRDLSLKEAQKQRFFYVMREDSPHAGASSHRRIVVPQSFYGGLNANNNYMPHARSYVCPNQNTQKLPCSRLLRTLNTSEYTKHSQVDVLQFVNSRYVDAGVQWKNGLPSSISQLWNLQALIIAPQFSLIAPIEIWKMLQLRHVESKRQVFKLPNPPTSKDDDIVVMENLRTLKGVVDLNLNEEVVKRIPNIQKLSISYTEGKTTAGVNCISYLHCLENLYFCTRYRYGSDKRLQKTSFPHSLKKLALTVSHPFEFDEDMLQKIGSLPLLQKLKLLGGRFKTRKWETIEGQFRSLKLLSLSNCRDLDIWTVSDSSHFPLLQELRFINLSGHRLEIPSEIGEIATMKSIIVGHCGESVVLSAKRIVDEQEDLHGEHIDLHVRAILRKQKEALQSLASPNFQVEVRKHFNFEEHFG